MFICVDAECLFALNKITICGVDGHRDAQNFCDSQPKIPCAFVSKKSFAKTQERFVRLVQAL